MGKKREGIKIGRPKIIAKIAAYGKQRWRINPDGSYSVLVWGTTVWNHNMGWHWLNMCKEKVPTEIKEVLK